VTADDGANTIIGIDATMEYKVGDRPFVKYDAGSPPSITGDETVLVRVASTGTIPAGEVTSLTFTAPIGVELQAGQSGIHGDKVYQEGVPTDVRRECS
jgi:hypothetical protein